MWSRKIKAIPIFGLYPLPASQAKLDLDRWKKCSEASPAEPVIYEDPLDRLYLGLGGFITSECMIESSD